LEPAAPGITRFSRVADGFFRGGQPDRAGLHWLKESGVRTIINLRLGGDEERTEVERAGMNYVHIPISLVTKPFGLPLNPWKRLPDHAIETFLRVLADASNYPVFVHCRRGADRTGAMVAFYRIAIQRWDAEAAYREARERGLSRWFRGVRKQVYEFGQRRSSAVSLPAHESAAWVGGAG